MAVLFISRYVSYYIKFIRGMLLTFNPSHNTPPKNTTKNRISFYSFCEDCRQPCLCELIRTCLEPEASDHLNKAFCKKLMIPPQRIRIPYIIPKYSLGNLKKKQFILLISFGTYINQCSALYGIVIRL